MKITGKELKANDGGPSKYLCWKRCEGFLRKHISGEERYFCIQCGSKYERQDGHFRKSSTVAFDRKHGTDFAGSFDSYKPSQIELRISRLEKKVAKLEKKK